MIEQVYGHVSFLLLSSIAPQLQQQPHRFSSNSIDFEGDLCSGNRRNLWSLFKCFIMQEWDYTTNELQSFEKKEEDDDYEKIPLTGKLSFACCSTWTQTQTNFKQYSPRAQIPKTNNVVQHWTTSISATARAKSDKIILINTSTVVIIKNHYETFHTAIKPTLIEHKPSPTGGQFRNPPKLVRFNKCT